MREGGGGLGGGVGLDIGASPGGWSRFLYYTGQAYLNGSSLLYYTGQADLNCSSFALLLVTLSLLHSLL